MPWSAWLLPYDFSPLTLTAYLVVLLLYLTALRYLPKSQKPGMMRVSAFLVGLGLCYAVMQTRFDYFSQYMFFVHRGQHLVLHHLGPILIALSNPLPVFRYWRSRSPDNLLRLLAPLGSVYRFLQQPALAAFLFVGLIYFWLWPPLHFDAMLSRNLYWVMNWSMLLDGLLFWWLMLDPRSPVSKKVLGYGRRLLILALVAVPQIVLGAYIVFSRSAVYDVYEVCGRAWPIAPETDQVLGGLLTWIPPAMMSILGMFIVFRRLMNQNEPLDEQKPSLSS
ncbi:cytochrome c oxidase assembly protein [Marinobacter sp.]|uniref:cytochrome c oxidase assembly protein n=1 Tax=Marinobacter sp. TaxID=50741 RepID=UPI00385171DB